MKIAIDVSPISGTIFGGHKIRGVGKVVKTLQDNLPKYDSKNEYVFFKYGDTLPQDIDIIHYPYFELFFRSLPLIKQKRTLVTVYDLIPIKFKEHFPSGIKGMAIWELQKRLLARMDGVITDSQSAQSDVVSFTSVPKEKTQVVYLATEGNFKPIHDKKSLEPIRKKYKLPDEFVLYVGDVTWNKNLPNLVRAIKKINLTLVFVGKSIAEKNFDKTNAWNKDRVIVENLIEGDKRFIKLGFVSDEDLNAIYNLADVFVMPSQYEGFGLPILESMQAGCPVVTSQSGSIPEVAGQAVQYVDPNDVEDIASGIGQVFFDKDLQKQLCQKGLEQGKKFSIEKMIKDMVSAYETFGS